MKIGELAPCGKKDCSECEGCIFDLPLDTPLKINAKDKMKNFGLVPVADNPATAQLIIPGIRNIQPNVGTQLSLPFKESNQTKKDAYCNNCEHFVALQRPNKNTFNTRCSAESPRPGGAYRVIKLNVYPEEKVRKPFWCPILKKLIIGADTNEKHITVGGKAVYPSGNGSAMSDEQLDNWNRIRHEQAMKEKWLAMSGLTAWDDIEIFKVYHMPPTIKKGRMDIRVKTKYINSMQCEDVKTGRTIWLYKDDEEYKFLSPVK